MARIKIKAKKGKKGTKIADGHLIVRGGGKPKGKAMFDSHAQMNIHLSDKRSQ